MAPKADLGSKFDQGKLNRILALVDDLSEYDLSILIHKLNEIRNRKKHDKKDNTDTIRT